MYTVAGLAFSPNGELQFVKHWMRDLAVFGLTEFHTNDIVARLKRGRSALAESDFDRLCGRLLRTIRRNALFAVSVNIDTWAYECTTNFEPADPQFEDQSVRDRA